MKITQSLVFSFLLCLGTVSVAIASSPNPGQGCEIPQDAPKKPPKK